MAKSKEESLGFLKKYKDQLTDQQYKNVAMTIGHQAIEGIYCTEESVDRMVRIEKGELTFDQALDELFFGKEALHGHASSR
ncbi:MAG: antitoxin VbhA family protein [Epsilonproteobacteria bacterium]|nr:antitoxin VbhA family protein [Campylobacterota bacterium]